MTDFPSHNPRNVAALLLSLRQEAFSGRIVVSGSPSGRIHLREGLVIAVDTPAAPAAESALLKSRRVSEEDWATACETSAADGRLDTALVAHGFVGAAELEVVCTSAVFDGAFAMALSTPDGWQVEDRSPRPRIALCTGVEPQRLTDEVIRRLGLLSQLWGPPSELARTRLRPTARAESGTVKLSPRYRDILLSANGRRTPRDIAFALGRGVFAVMLDLTRMTGRQLVQREPTGPLATAPDVAVRTAATTGPPRSGSPAPLPRRNPGSQTVGPPVSQNTQEGSGTG